MLNPGSMSLTSTLGAFLLFRLVFPRFRASLLRLSRGTVTYRLLSRRVSGLRVAISGLVLAVQEPTGNALINVGVAMRWFIIRIKRF